MIKKEIDNLNTNWKPILNKICFHLEAEAERCKNLNEFIEQEYQTKKVYPEKINIFKAFNYFDFEKLRVVIIGQDPYHQPNQAHGLSFSVNKGVKIPPSLKNIFKEIKNNFNIDSQDSFSHGCLEEWAKQGVLLLNTSLTVVESMPNSHSKHWRFFTNLIIKYIVNHNKNIVFLLWGGNAKKIKKLFTEEEINNHFFLEANHPSPLSANRGGWFNLNHFKKTNDILGDLNLDLIDWTNL